MLAIVSFEACHLPQVLWSCPCVCMCVCVSMHMARHTDYYKRHDCSSDLKGTVGVKLRDVYISVVNP